MLPKVEGRPKGIFAVFSALSDIFPNSIKGYHLEFFEDFGLLKTFNKPKGSIFRVFYQIRFF